MWHSTASGRGVINALIICLKFPLSLVLQFPLITVLLRWKYSGVNVIKFISVTSYFLLSTMKTDCHGNSQTRSATRTHVKNKGLPCARAYMGNRGKAPLIPNLGGRLRWMVKFTPWPPYLLENFPVTIELGGLLGLITVLDVLETRKSPATDGIRVPDHLAHNLVGIPTTLLRLLRAPVISVALLRCCILKVLQYIWFTVHNSILPYSTDNPAFLVIK